MNRQKIHSKEVEEILHTPPPWLLRWGVSLIFAVLVALVICSAFIPFTKVVSSAVRLTRSCDPAAPEITGECFMKAGQASELMIGQKAGISLDDHPLEANGPLQGEISEIFRLPGSDLWLIRIRLPKDIKTIHDVSIQCGDKRWGRAEIVTQNKTLLEKIMGKL